MTKTLESEIQRRVFAAIGAEPDLLLLRNQVGQARYVDDRTGRAYSVPYGLGVGSPDLVGMLRSPGGLAFWFALEIKTPGETPRPEQRTCHEVWRRFGALLYVATSPEEARAALEDARGRVRGCRS